MRLQASPVWSRFVPQGLLFLGRQVPPASFRSNTRADRLLPYSFSFFELAFIKLGSIY